MSMVTMLPVPHDADAAEIESCLRGQKLYGDDFDAERLAQWYRDEAHGYQALGAGDRKRYRYAYHALNWLHGYRHLPECRFGAVLGIGSAYGDELLPLFDRIGSITILEPADAFAVEAIGNVPVRYVSPQPGGTLPFDDDAFDLVTCFGVLHHLPNVSAVLREVARVLRSGGHALVREPIVSMGDWRRARPGLTKRERGIPRDLFRSMVRDAGLSEVRATPCMFPVTRRMGRWLRDPVYNQRWAVHLDAMLCRLPLVRYRYHPRTTLQKLQAACLYFVLRKD